MLIIWRQTQGHSTSPRTSLSWLGQPSTLSVTRELMEADWSTKLQPQHLLDQLDMPQSSRLENRPFIQISQDGLCQKQVVLRPKLRNLTKIRPMTPEVVLASNKFQRTKRHRKHTLERPVENTWRSWELSRTWCRVEPVSNVTFQNGETPFLNVSIFSIAFRKIKHLFEVPDPFDGRINQMQITSWVNLENLPKSSNPENSLVPSIYSACKRASDSH